MAARVKEKYYSYEDFPIEDLLLYAGLDCICTSELAWRVWPVVTEKPYFIKSKKGRLVREKIPSIMEMMEDVQMPAYNFIMDMEINGMGYNVATNIAMKTKIEKEIETLEDRIFTKIGRRIDLNSGQAMAKYLYGELGLEALSWTKKKEPSTDGDALLKLAEVNNIDHLGWIAKRNDIASVYRTFLRNYVEDYVKPDGRIHPSYNLNGTSSFRISGDNPNLTQLPRPKHGYNVRSCFNVRPGYIFLALDFSSAEVKILGALCKDPTMLKAIAEGKDFHSFSASMAHGIPYDEFVHVLEEGDKAKRERKSENIPKNYKLYKEWRQAAKTLTLNELEAA